MILIRCCDASDVVRVARATPLMSILLYGMTTSILVGRVAGRGERARELPNEVVHALLPCDGTNLDPTRSTTSAMSGATLTRYAPSEQCRKPKNMNVPIIISDTPEHPQCPHRRSAGSPVTAHMRSNRVHLQAPRDTHWVKTCRPKIPRRVHRRIEKGPARCGVIFLVSGSLGVCPPKMHRSVTTKILYLDMCDTR